MIRAGRGRARTAVIILGVLGLIGAYQGVSTGAAEPDSLAEALKSSRAQAEAINNVSDVPSVVQNLVPGTLEARDLAVTRFKAAGASAAAGSKPEYAVVWAGKNNIGDMSGNDWMRFVGQGSISPTGLLNVGTKQWLGGLDAMVVVDVRKANVDGTPNHDYGKVVNFVTVPPPFGVEGEPHHMQYEWQPGQPIIAGHLFTDLTSIWDVGDIPNITLKNIVRGEENPLGAFPDAYDFVGDKAIGTYMTAGEPNYGGSPGSVVVFRPDSAKGMVQEAEVPASQVGAVLRGNPGGVPEPCTLEEARPMGTCGNPHGIQARPDLGRMVTNDYGDARELGSDPLKTVHEGALRPTSRIWDISDPSHPKLISVAHMPKSFKNTPNPAHGNIGIMEGAKTYGTVQGLLLRFDVRRRHLLPARRHQRPARLLQPVEAGLGRRHGRDPGARPHERGLGEPGRRARRLRRWRLAPGEPGQPVHVPGRRRSQPRCHQHLRQRRPEDDLRDQHREARQERRRTAPSTAASTAAGSSARATATRPTAPPSPV